MLASRLKSVFRGLFYKTLVFYGIAALILWGLQAPLSAAVTVSTTPAAAAFTLRGSYIYAGLNVNGTFGQGTGRPGLQYDSTGTGSFSKNQDYLYTSLAVDIMTVKLVSGGTTTSYLNSSGSSSDSGGIINNKTSTQISNTGYDNYVRWSSGVSGKFNIVQDVYFNNTDQRINFEITITALTALSSLKYLRRMDPDPMIDVYGATTYNGRGADGVPDENWVHATQADGSGNRIFPIGYFSASSVVHNVGYLGPWRSGTYGGISTDPDSFLSGPAAHAETVKADDSLGIAFDLGAMTSGQSITFRYAIILAGNLADAIVPITSVTVSPDPINLLVGETAQASVTVLPSNANQLVTWESGNTSVATVSSTGVVTGTGFGSTTILATSDQDASKTDTLTVNVSEPLYFTRSISTNTFVTGVGLSTPGASIVVDRGLTVSGASVFGGSVSITGGFVTGQDVLTATNQSGITGSYNSTTGVLTLSGTATAAQYQAFLRTVTYGNTQNSPNMGTRTLQFSLNYGVPVRALTQDVTIAMQQPSNLTGTVSSQIYFTGEDEFMPIDSGLGLTGPSLTDFKFYLPSGTTMTATTSGGLSESYVSGTGILTISGTGTAATYQSAARSVGIKPNSVGSNFSVDVSVGHLQYPTLTETFGYASVGSDATAAASMATSKTYYGWTGSAYSINTGAKTVVVAYSTPAGGYGGPTTLTRSVSFTKYTAPGIVATVTQNVMVLDPDLDAPPASIVLDEQLSLTGGSSQDSPLREARVRFLTNYQSGYDSLSATASGGLSVSWDGANASLTISGTGTVAAYEAVLRTVVYGNSANSPNTASRTIRFEIDYGGTNLTTKTIGSNVVVSFLTPNRMSKNATTTMNYYVKSSPVTVDASVTVSGPSLSGAYVKIVSGFDAGKDALSVTDVGSLSGSYNSGTGLLTITGTGTAAEYQTMLRSVKYANTSGSPSYTDRQIVFVLGHVLPDFNTGHFYVSRSGAVTWSQAKALAAGTSYLGYRGYLAAVTSATETTHIGTLGISTNTWLGGSDEASEGVWRWRTGPEGLENGGLGRQFWQGAQFGSTTAPNNYAAFSSGQPDNSGNQDYLAVNSQSEWGDMGSSSLGYVVEYVGFVGEHAVTASKTVEVRQRPVLQLSTSTNVFVKNAGAVLLDEQLVVAGYTISSASVQIGSGFDALTDSMGATSQHGITVGYVTANGTLNLTGTATSKSYQDVLRTVWYLNSAVTPVEGTRNMVYTLRFGDDPYFTTEGSLSVGIAPVYTMSGSAVTANFFSGRGALPVPTGLSVTGGMLDSAIVKIVSNYRSTEDRLSATANYGISVSYDIPSGVLTLSGAGTAAEYESVLSSVAYNNIAVSPSPLTKQIQFVLGSKVPTVHNLHFYDKYEYSTLPAIPQEWSQSTRQHSYVTGTALSWDQARFLASTRAYLGWKGYLSTVTSLSEAQTIGGLLTGEAWLGATDRASQNIWRWVTGPEGLENSGVGRLFSNGGTSVGGYYTYWSSGQPSGGSGEDYMHMVYSPSLGGQYQWTDLPVGGTGPVYLPKQYVSEYGGFAGESTFWVEFPVKVFGSNHTIFFGTMF